MTASLATCPLCAKQLAIPEGTSADDRAECPECDATFLLSNAFQTSLPTARILTTTEAIPATETSPTESASAESTAGQDESTAEREKLSSEVAGVASLASWESRLKNAIERDASELVDLQTADDTPSAETSFAETLSPETAAIETASPDLPPPPTRPPAPEFEFHIDPPLAEQSIETEKQPLREFDQAEILATESTEPAANPLETASVTSEPTASELAEADELTIGLTTLHTRRSRGFSPLKVAAVLIGPGLMGIFLGLYALLWIKGPSGDLVNLAQVLPTAMLPPMVAAQETDNPPKTSPPSGDGLGSLTKSGSLTKGDGSESLVSENPAAEQVPPETEHLKTEPPKPRRDEAVRTVAAEQPVPQALSTLPALFGELLAAARAAEPNLVKGDLSTNAAVSKKGQAYMAICQLSQHFELTHTPHLDAPSQAEIATAKDLFDSLASQASARSDLAAITSRWWGYESRPNQGIFLAGQIQKIQPLGDKTLCYVALDEPLTTTVIPVLLDQPPARENERIVVVGSIVAKPRTSLPNFTVDASQVVVAAYTRPLPP